MLLYYKAAQKRKLQDFKSGSCRLTVQAFNSNPSKLMGHTTIGKEQKSDVIQPNVISFNY